MRTRESWDEYFMRVAEAVSTRSTCDRNHVGAVLVVDKTIVATGYNGSIKGLPHCDDVGHLMIDSHCLRTVHAEMNALAQAAMNGNATKGATLYVTSSPCWSCFKVLANAGIKRMVFGNFYRDERIFQAAEAAGITLSQVQSNQPIEESEPDVVSGPDC